MFTAMLRAQWIWSRAMMLVFLGAGFSIPLVSVPLVSRGRHTWMASANIVDLGGVIGIAIAITVTIAAVALEIQNWSVDERGGHVYTLSLPIDRRRYAAYRLAGSFLLLALLCVAIAAGGMSAGALLDLPSTLRTYPIALAIRALLAGWFVHTLAFAFRLGAWDRSGKTLFGALSVVALAVILPSVWPGTTTEWMSMLGRLLIAPSGPLGILAGHWSLIDV